VSEEVKDAISEVAVTGPRGAKAKKRWTPKEWRPEYTAIVALSATGMSNEAVGKHFNYTKVHISNILCCPQAIEIRKLINAKLLEDQTVSLPDRLKRVQDMALGHVETFMNDSRNLMEKSPFQVFDRALKVLQGTNAMVNPDAKNNGATTNIQQNTFVLSDAAAKALTDGLAKSQLVQTLHAHLEPVSIEPKKLTGLVAD
jgi:hypothetical protein